MSTAYSTIQPKAKNDFTKLLKTENRHLQCERKSIWIHTGKWTGSCIVLLYSEYI